MSKIKITLPKACPKGIEFTILHKSSGEYKPLMVTGDGLLKTIIPIGKKKVFVPQKRGKKLIGWGERK